jgi:GH24 family phage-related lysozyme (muramidase)
MNYEILKKEIMDDEGYKNQIYLDHLGYPTVGIGHLIKPDDPEYGKPIGTLVSGERVTELFIADAESAIKDCKKLFANFDTIPEDIQHVLVNMMFNLGYTRFSKFKNFKAALDVRNWKKASVEGRDSLWYRQVPNRAKRLMDRLENGK